MNRLLQFRLLALALLPAIAAPPLKADKLLHNLAGRMLVLKVESLELDQIAVKIQSHATGKTPKQETLNIFLEVPEESKVERKVFLNEDLAGKPDPAVVTLASGTASGAAREVQLRPGGSATFYPVLSGQALKPGSRNRVVLQVHSIDSSLKPYPVRVPEGLTVTYEFSTDAEGRVRETLVDGVQARSGDCVRRVAFAPMDHSGPLTLVDCPGGGCCAIQ